MRVSTVHGFGHSLGVLDVFLWMGELLRANKYHVFCSYLSPFTELYMHKEQETVYFFQIMNPSFQEYCMKVLSRSLLEV